MPDPLPLPRTRLGELFARHQRRRNARALMRYGAFVLGIACAYGVLFQIIMRTCEHQRPHSWITGFYWAVSTMTTLGLGDVVFESDVGRLFTSVVLVSGILLFLVVLPFAFIRYFYAPWSETLSVPARLTGHVVIASADNIGLPLIAKLQLHGIPYYVVEPDVQHAAALQADGVVTAPGEIDDPATYTHLRVAAASLVVANAADTTNANIALTVREVAPHVPIAALAEHDASVPILRRAGATHVLPLKERLGEHLANRLNAGHAQSHVIGSFRDLLIAEFPVHHTPLVGKTIREIALRERLGLNIIGVLDQARFVPARPDTRLSEHCAPVVAGTREQIEALDEFLIIYDHNYSPVLVIGGGKVSCAATHLLQRKGLTVHLIDRHGLGEDWSGPPADRLFVGDAAQRPLLEAAGLAEAPGVLLTTSDDAMNIYLAVQCRWLAPDARIVSRVTHDRNLAAIRRAGADVALSHTSLGVESIFAARRGDEIVILGEAVELHELPVPAALAGRTLGQAGIAARTGLNVIAIQSPAGLVANPTAATRLDSDGSLLMIGDQSQLNAFIDAFGRREA